jgi:hypothetical protein
LSFIKSWILTCVLNSLLLMKKGVSRLTSDDERTLRSPGQGQNTKGSMALVSEGDY